MTECVDAAERVNLDLVGEGEDRTTLEARVCELGIGTRVLFTGLGIALVAAYAALRLAAASRADGEGRSAYRTLGVAALVAILAILLQ